MNFKHLSGEKIRIGWGGQGVEVAMPPIPPLSKVLEPFFFSVAILKKQSLTKKKNTLSAKCLNYVINKTKQRYYWRYFKTASRPSQHKESSGCTAGRTDGQTHSKQGARENKPVGKIQPKVFIIYLPSPFQKTHPVEK